MEWSLAIVALALLGVAAISRRVSGAPVTAAMVFVAFGLLVGPKVLDGIDLESTSSTGRSAEWPQGFCSRGSSSTPAAGA